MRISFRIYLEPVSLQLKFFQKLTHMISVSSCVMTCDGKRHDEPAVFRGEFTCFYRREVVRLVLVVMDGKMLK